MRPPPLSRAYRASQGTSQANRECPYGRQRQECGVLSPFGLPFWPMFKTRKPRRSMIYVTPYVRTRFHAEDATRFVPAKAWLRIRRAVVTRGIHNLHGSINFKVYNFRV